MTWSWPACPPTDGRSAARGVGRSGARNRAIPRSSFWLPRPLRPAARQGWEDAGVEIPLPIPPKPRVEDPYKPGMVVRHASYGLGQVIGMFGLGATRTVKVRFPTAGEQTFRLNHVKLEVVPKE